MKNLLIDSLLTSIAESTYLVKEASVYVLYFFNNKISSKTARLIFVAIVRVNHMRDYFVSCHHRLTGVLISKKLVGSRK